jgi:hypothetical protein
MSINPMQSAHDARPAHRDIVAALPPHRAQPQYGWMQVSAIH